MDEKLRNLLADQVTLGLSDDEARELGELLGSADGSMDAQSFELTAAAIALAETRFEPMPASLEAKLARVAEEYFGTAEGEVDESIHDQPTRAFRWEEAKRSRSFFDWFGWAAAAMACIALAMTFFYNQNRINELQAKVEQLTPKPTPEETLAQKRDRLKAAGAEIARAEWTKGNVKETETVTGEVVWSDAKQEGYMTFRGLPVNDSNLEAYQLWIFEDAKLEEFPKDGGVFNVTSSGEVIIPIDPKLRTLDPKAFAVTIEKPGGVVRSDRSKIALLAPVKPSTT
ncbi:MAG: anti-sigma factor [bacterium]|nr:anti-sigma factor [bacterium]